MNTRLSISPQEMARYQATARRRTAQRWQLLSARRQRALVVAQEAAALLKVKYGAERVVCFGSLARAEPFSQYSDIDLAVWGLDDQVFYQAVAQLLDLDPTISIDLLRGETLSANLLKVIEAEGTCL